MKMLNRVVLSSIFGLALCPMLAEAKCHYGESVIMFGDGPYFGPVTCEPGEISSLTVFGPTKTNGTIIKGDVKVMGLFEGVATDVGGKFSVLGPVKLNDSMLHQEALLANDKTILSNSIVDENMVITSDTSADLYLQKNSVVKGNIQFDSRHRGKVHVESGSIIYGQVKNGDVLS
jgi:hypothetical protein